MMAQYIRSIDPFQHLRSTSFADDGPRSSYTPFWQLPEMEIVQVHQYSILYPQEHINLISQVRQFGKPVIMGEGSASGDPETLDSNGQSLHDTIWAAAVVESGAMSWWWDSWIHPHNLYYRFEPLVAFLADEDWAPQQLSPLSYTILSGHTTPEVYGSAGFRHAYLYIRNWQGSVSGLRLRLSQVTSPGTYSIEYWDTNSNSPYQTATTTGSTGGLQLNLPNFVRDIAVKVRQMGPTLTTSPPSLTADAFVGHEPAPQVFTVTNTGWGTANYEITADASWLSASPSAGSVADEADTITVSYTTASLAAGTYTALITVTDTDGFSAPAIVSVTLDIALLPADLDADGDIDQQDFGILQTCLSGAGIDQTGSDCNRARLDADPDVDADDVAVFIRCLTGPSVPGNPACAN